MRVVVLTNRSARGVAIIEALARTGISMDAIVVDADKLAMHAQAKKARRVIASRGVAETSYRIRRKLQRVRARLRKTERDLGFYREFSEAVVEVPNANAAECERVLRSLAPDVIVLGGARILKEHILRIPTIGVLNPHPGLLPAYRGVDVIPWAIYKGDPIGVTVHFVDPGVDTGDIVAQHRLPVHPGDTLRSLKRRADRMLGELMAEILSDLAASGQVERHSQESSGHLYSLMPPDLKAQVKAKLKAMDARAGNRKHPGNSETGDDRPRV